MEEIRLNQRGRDEIYSLKQENVSVAMFDREERTIHILKRHGNPLKEKKKKQIVVKKEDTDFIPSIIQTFDRVELKGLGIRFWKLINGFYYICVCTIEKDKLMVKTMYIKPQLKNFKKSAS